MMVVIAIIGILAAIALPSYQSSVEKTNLADAKRYMTEIRQQLEAQKLSDISYRRGSATDLKTKYEDFIKNAIEKNIPSSMRGKYTFSCNVVAVNNKGNQASGNQASSNQASGNQVSIYMQARPSVSSYKYAAYMTEEGDVLRCPKASISDETPAATKPSGCEAF